MKFGGISNARSFFLQFPDRPFDNMMQSYLRFACRLAILFYSMGVVAASELTARREDRQVVIRDGDREILRYQAEAGELPRKDIPKAYTRGAYIQSLLTPSGRQITDDFPRGHLHHHGIWNPWTKTEFEGRTPDFWNSGKETDTVEFVALDRVWQKDGKAGFQARHQFVDLSIQPPKVALLETWNITASAADDCFVIDFTSTQTCAGDSPLTLPKYHYGGFGFRGNGAWNGADQCRFLTASGLTDRKRVNTSRENWCWIGGKVDGLTCGLAILNHPKNFRFPQPIRAHPTEPFFCYAPQQLGEMSIKPGQPYVARFRLIIADGEPDPEMLDRYWKEYSEGR